MQETEKLKIEDVLREKGVYMGPTVGVSMLPMLKERRDTIVVRPKTQRLNRLDVALYKRGDAYILHRVLEQTETGYIIRGDNCYSDEIVPESAVIGVLTEFFQADKHVLCTDAEYIAYAEKRGVFSCGLKVFFWRSQEKFSAFSFQENKTRIKNKDYYGQTELQRKRKALAKERNAAV